MLQDPFVGDNVIRLVGEISATAARLNIETWSWSDATLSKAFLETVEGKMQSTDSLQQIAAMDALAAFGSSSDKGGRLLSEFTRIHRLLNIVLSYKMTRTPSSSPTPKHLSDVATAGQ